MMVKKTHYVRVGKRARGAIDNLRRKYNLCDEEIVKLALLHFDHWAENTNAEEFARQIGGVK